MKRSSAFAVAAVLVCTACATLAPPRVDFPIPAAGPIHRAIAAAEARLDSAARRGDAGGVAAMFTDDAILVVASDTVRGHDAIHQIFRQIRSGADSARLTFTPRVTDVCMDGAVEYGQEVSVELHPARDTVRTMRFRYAIRWVVFGPNTVRATALVISRPTDIWKNKFKDCVLANQVAFDRHRVAATVSMPLAANSWTTFSSMHDVLRQRGYFGFPAVGISGLSQESNPTAWWYGAGVRLRLWRPLSAEVVVGLQPRSATSVGYRPADSSVVTLSFSGGYAWAALNYEWRRLRFGVGPFLVRTSWTIKQQYWASPTSSFLWTVAKDKWNDQRVGLLIESAYVFPFTRAVFVEAQAHLRLLGKTMTRSTPAFSPAQVTLNGFGLSLGAGLAH